MLPLEAIAVLGFLYCFFMYATVKTQLERRNISIRAKIRESRLGVAVANIVAVLSSNLQQAFSRSSDETH